MLYRDMFPLVVSVVRLAPAPWVETELKESASAFFEQSQVWQEELDPVLVSQGDTRAELDLPPGAALSIVLSVRLGPALLSVSRDVVVDAESIVFASPCSQDAELAVTASLKPSYAARGIPNDMDEYMPSIIQGAIARLKSQGNVEWSDQNGALVALGRFKEGIARARRKSILKNKPNTLAVKPVFFM